MKPPVKRFDKKGKRIIWQRHHIIYGEYEQVVSVRKKAHFYITCLQRFGSFTPEEKKAIRYIMRTKPDCKDRPPRRKSVR